jgi:hypothetical protein
VGKLEGNNHLYDRNVDEKVIKWMEWKEQNVACGLS